MISYYKMTLSPRTDMSAEQVRDRLALCPHTTYLVYDEVIYSQVGAAMGSPASPVVAHMFMEWFKEQDIETFTFEIELWH